MKITILGCAGANGCPKIGNVYGDLDPKNPKNNRTRCCFVLEDNNELLWVECGPDFRQQSINFNSNNLKNIFISHGHSDHCIGVWELRNVTKELKSNINIYCDKWTIEEIKSIFPYLFKEGKIGYKLNLQEIKTGEKFIPDNTSLDLLPMIYDHKKAFSTGFRYKNFALSPDYHNIPESSEENLYNLDLWLLEASTITPQNNGHLTLEESLALIKKFKPKRAILNHLTLEMDYEKVSKILPKNVELCYDGMVIEI